MLKAKTAAHMDFAFSYPYRADTRAKDQQNALELQNQLMLENPAIKMLGIKFGLGGGSMEFFPPELPESVLNNIKSAIMD